jgi:prepilin-type N-terminal cleavage/methylation domain-containing protein
MSNKKNNSGYSLVELLLALAVGSIVILGAYSSYVIILKQQQNNNQKINLTNQAIPSLQIISRDLRMAGHVAFDGNIDSAYGSISTPLTITDSGNDCCDTLEIIYDKSTDERLRVTYNVSTRSNPSRNALFMSVEQWNGVSWIAVTTNAIVADYIEDFQAVGSDNNSAGFPTMVDLHMMFRTKNQTNKLYTYIKPSYEAGNYNYSFSDYYYRDKFAATIRIRNLVD